MVVLLPTVVAEIMVEELPGSFTACIPSLTTSDVLTFFNGESAVSAASHSKSLWHLTSFKSQKLVPKCHLEICIKTAHSTQSVQLPHVLSDGFIFFLILLRKLKSCIQLFYWWWAKILSQSYTMLSIMSNHSWCWGLELVCEGFLP